MKGNTMKSFFTFMYLFLQCFNSFAFEEQKVRGSAECQRKEKLEFAATLSAMEQCRSPITQISEWLENPITCSTSDGKRWDSLSIEAWFVCKKSGIDGKVVTSGYWRDFRPFAIKEALERATKSAKELCQSNVKLISKDLDINECHEGICSVQAQGLFECSAL